jgi:DNA-binding MarR family transcriptional regulator
MTSPHPRHRLDSIIHAPVRLSIVAALSGIERIDFKSLQSTLDVSESALSKHLATLEAAGYVQIEKGRINRRPRTWLAITPAGATALTGHFTALHDIATLEPSNEDTIHTDKQDRHRP